MTKDQAKAQAIKRQYELGVGTRNKHMEKDALRRYERLVDRLGYDPLAR